MNFQNFHRRNFFTCVLAFFLCALAAMAQVGGTPESAPGLTLTPAVIMVKAKPGQVFYQELRLWNNTLDELRFHMEAEDIVVRNGKRVLVPAGETEGGIARYAVFTENDLIALPGSSVATTVTITMPSAATTRAIACIFRGATPIGSAKVNMTASLGALVTFSGGGAGSFKVESQPASVKIDSSARMIEFSESLTNTGEDPIVPKGVVAILNENGNLVAKVPITGPRLLPGESYKLIAEHPGLPRPGKYKAQFLLENENAVFTNAAEFTVK
jgi:hypothetical protein